MAGRNYKYGAERVRKVFEDLYPEITDDQIRTELEGVEEPKPDDIPVVQAFYKEPAIDPVAEDLQLGVAVVHHAIEDAIKALPSDSKLRVALQMGYLNEGLLED